MGNEDSKLRKLFESYDLDNDGQLGLNDILEIRKIDDLRFVLKSPSLLYQIDEGQDGKLNFEEFAKLLRHLKTKNKTKVREKKKDKKIWTAVSEEDAKDYQLTRNAETPMFVNSQYSLDEEIESVMSDEDQKIQINEEEKKVMNEENKNILLNILATPKGRRRYMNWLFKLADVQKKGSIDAKELELILKALELDGVKIMELSYDQSQEVAISGITKKLMEEYDSDNDGRISQEEFMIFADLVVKNYQIEKEEEEMIMKRYILKRKLGSGASGVVKLAWDNKRNEKVAIKIIRKGNLNDMSRVDKEIQAMLMLSHPSITSLYKVLQSDTDVYLVMEYCAGGTLADYISLKPISEELARFYFAQVVEGVRYCHLNGVVHRDLKLENLLLTKNGNIKITDFGHVGIFSTGWDMFSTSLVGSLFHLSPEQIEGKIYSGEKIDIWALGVVLYRMIIGKPPFFDKNVNKFVENIKQVNLEYPEGNQISEEAKDLMSMIFKYEPSKRISCDDILRHKWIVIGEKGKPSLDRVEIILGDPGKIEQEDAWKVLCYIIKNKMNMTFHEKSSKNSNIIKTCNCIYPPKDLKLSIQMKLMESNSGSPSPFNILLHTISSSSTLNPKNGFYSPKVSSSPKTTALINIEIKNVIAPKFSHPSFFSQENSKGDTLSESSSNLELNSSKEDTKTYPSLNSQKSQLSNSKKEVPTPQEFSPPSTPLDSSPSSSSNQISLNENSLKCNNKDSREINLIDLSTPTLPLSSSRDIKIKSLSPVLSESENQLSAFSYPPLLPSNLIKSPENTEEKVETNIRGSAEVFNLDSKISVDTSYSTSDRSNSNNPSDLDSENRKKSLESFQELRIQNENPTQNENEKLYSSVNLSSTNLSSSDKGFSLNFGTNIPKSNLIDTPLLSSFGLNTETPSTKRNSTSLRSYFFIFDLREGDCWDFINTIERIKNHFSSTYQLYINGKLEVEEENETKDYYTSEPVLSFSELNSISTSPKKKSNKNIKSSKSKKLSKEEESSIKTKRNKDDENSPLKAKSSVISIPISEEDKKQNSSKTWKSTSTGSSSFITRDAKIPNKKSKKGEKEVKVVKEDSN